MPNVTVKTEIPCQFFQESWEDASHPMCCIDLHNRFVKCNSAWELLLGYSSEELKHKTWVDVTKPEHVGGDLASVKAVMDGRLTEYRMEKEYIHKHGHYVPVSLIVRRFPRQATDKLLYFKVEAPMAIATRPELDEINERVVESLAKFRRELEEIKNQGVKVHVGDTLTKGDKVGRNKLTNSDVTIRVMVGGLVFISLILAWLFYYVAATISRQPVDPPKVQAPLE